MFRHQFGMLAQSVTRPLDLHDDGVMQQSVEKRGGDNWIAEDIAPFSEAAV
ncbi:hypothetical protein C8J32_11427 [Rhizobium sp. PP-CC-3A-592]|nr:hypothetical protein C8J32_11427 [Rhizobium sp. PP-CC-3A-592]